MTITMKRIASVVVGALVVTVVRTQAVQSSASCVPGETLAQQLQHRGECGASAGQAAAAVAASEQSAVQSATPSGTYVSVSFHKPDGIAFSTGNVYFTSHDVYGAHVFRTGQTSSPGQEATLYSEPPGSRFGDIAFANVDGVYYGYFFAANGFGQVSIKRILLTGSTVADVLTSTVNNIDIVNSHHNLVTDGVDLYWQDSKSVRKIPIRGGVITVLDQTSANSPTAGVYLDGSGNLIYASMNMVRSVPIQGASTSAASRTMVTAAAAVTTIAPVDQGFYWGERSGSIHMKSGTTIYAIWDNAFGAIPTSIATLAGNQAIVDWTECGSTACDLTWGIVLPNNALGVWVNPQGTFWGDDLGLHRRDPDIIF